MSYSYDIAKDVLSDVEKGRIICAFLSSTDGTINWERATKEYGATSVDSMKVSHRNMLKKLEKAGAKDGVEATATMTPKATPKRKKNAAATDDIDDTPKKRGRKAKAKAETKVEDVEEEGVKEEGVKEEAADGEEA